MKCKFITISYLYEDRLKVAMFPVDTLRLATEAQDKDGVTFTKLHLEIESRGTDKSWTFPISLAELRFAVSSGRTEFCSINIPKDPTNIEINDVEYART